MRRKSKTKIFNTIIITILSFGIFAVAIGYSSYSQYFTIEGTATITAKSPIVVFDLQNSWQNGSGGTTYNYIVRILNNSNTAIEDWKILLETYDDVIVEACHGGTAEVRNNTNILIANAGYNMNIFPNESKDFNIQFTLESSNFKLNDYLFYDSNNPLPEEPSEPEEPDDKTPTAIELDRQSITMIAGSTDKLIATLTPEDAEGVIKWTSSNTDVATVSNTGEITAISAGTTTIRASVGNLNARCSVTVKREQISVNDIVITFGQSGGWQSGSDYFYQYNVSVKNNSDQTVTSWKFDLVFPDGGEIKASWNCSTENEGSTYTISNAGFNGTISPGMSQDFGMQLAVPVGDFVPEATNIVVTN